MKVFALLLAGMLLTGSAFGQGTLVFANTASANFRIFTNGASGPGPISGLNQWRVGLYVGPLGSDQGSLVLVGLTTNAAPSALAGYFSGGNPFFLSSPIGRGDPLTFQVRVWALAGGVTFDQALLNGSLVGMSSLGFVTPTFGPVPPAALFGTNPGQIGGFTLGLPICIPEPSTYALGLMGVVLFGLLGRKWR